MTHMKNQLYSLLSALAFLFPVHAIAAEPEKIVNVFSWNDYIGEHTLENFSKETGIKVHYDITDASEVMEAKIIAGKSGYDVAVPSSNPTVPRLISIGALHKFDKSKIPNLKYVDPQLAKIAEEVDPGNEHAVIYQYTVIGLGVNETKVREIIPDAPLDSLDLILKPEYAEKLSKCGIVMLDSALVMVSTLAHYYGFDKDTTNDDDLKKIETELLKIRPYIRYFHSSAYINDLASEDICLVIGYSGDVNQAASRARDLGSKSKIKFHVPREGSEFNFDMMVIPEDAEHLDNAYSYINYILRPDVMGPISNHIEYPNAIPDSRKYMSSELLVPGRIFLSNEDLKRTFTSKFLTKLEMRKRNRLWTKFIYNK